jgi:hypothetical protein
VKPWGRINTGRLGRLVTCNFRFAVGDAIGGMVSVIIMLLETLSCCQKSASGAYLNNKMGSLQVD